MGSNGSESAYSQGSPVSHTRLFRPCLLLSSLKWKRLSLSITSLPACLSKSEARESNELRGKTSHVYPAMPVRSFVSCGAGIHPLGHRFNSSHMSAYQMWTPDNILSIMPHKTQPETKQKLGLNLAFLTSMFSRLWTTEHWALICVWPTHIWEWVRVSRSTPIFHDSVAVQPSPTFC